MLSPRFDRARCARLVLAALVAAVAPASGDARAARAPGDTCTRATFEVGALPFAASGTTVGESDDYDLPGDTVTPTCTAPTACTGGGPAGAAPRGGVFAGTGTAPERAYRIRVDADCDLTISVADAAPHWDAALVIYEEQCSSSLADCVCVDDDEPASSVESVVLEAMAGVDYFVVVDGYSPDGVPPGPAGAYDLEIAGAGCALVDPDGTPPSIVITTPTAAPSWGAGSTPTALGGTAADDFEVTHVTWTNDRGGAGTAAGTTTWTADVPLQAGVNQLTVAAWDPGGNSATDTASVTYEPRTIFAGGATFTRAATPWDDSPEADLEGVSPVASQDHLFETGWWYRIAGDPREAAFGTPDAEHYALDQSSATWNDVGGRGRFAAVESGTLVGSAAGGHVTLEMALTNLDAGNALAVELFHMADLDLQPVAGDDGGVLAAWTPSRRIDLDDGGANFASYVAADVGATGAAYLVRPFGAGDVGSLLADPLLDDFDDSGLPFGPGDWTGGYQFHLVVPAGGSAAATVRIAVDAALECGSPEGVFCDGLDLDGTARWSVVVP